MVILYLSLRESNQFTTFYTQSVFAIDVSLQPQLTTMMIPADS